MKTKIVEEVNLNVEDHMVRVDHIIYLAKKDILCEDKAFNIEAGIIQNFDQMRTYSLMKKGGRKLLGIVSTLDRWVFTCYVVPEGLNLKNKNFLHSPTYHLDTTKPEKVQKMIIRLRKFMEEGFSSHL